MISTAKAYHRATSYDRLRMKGHYLDWAHQPRVYKIYPEADVVALPDASPTPKVPLHQVSAADPAAPKSAHVHLELLSRILMLSYCFTAKSRHGGHDFYYRSAASAGALYPCELYLATEPLDGLAPGVYHYGLHNRSLACLRRGNFTAAAGKCFADPALSPAPVYLFITAIFFRSAWKYRERAFRYVLLDAGHLLENLVLALKWTGLPFSPVYDFHDKTLETVLGIDGKREGILAGVAIDAETEARNVQAPPIQVLPESTINAGTVSAREVSYAEIESFYRASGKLPDVESAPVDLMGKICTSPEPWIGIDPLDPSPEDMAYPDAVLRRRSKRNFVDRPLSRSRFMRLLGLVSRSARQDLPPGHRYGSAVVTGFITGNIDGIPPGFYLLDPIRGRFGLVFKGYFTSKMASVCLDQDWLRNAAVHFLFLTDLAEIDGTWGPRGYRYAMLAAGRIGQAVYTAATALGLGACGIGALYDPEARELLCLNDDSALLYLVAAGPVKGR